MEAIADRLQFFVNAGAYGKNLRVIGAQARSMKVLFAALHLAYYRNFESVVRELAARGHRVHLAADEPEALGGQELAERLAAEYPGP